jgi:surfeit locus 1 family protein
MKKIIGLVFTLVIFFVLVILGFWQLSRAHEKEALLTQTVRFANSAPMDFKVWLLHPQDYQKVTITGFFIPNKNVFIDKMSAAGQVGFEVLSAFDTAGKLLLIDRGFIEGSRTQRQIPFLPSVEGTVTFIGKMKPFEKKSVQLGKTDLTHFPLQLTSFNGSLLQQAFGNRLLPYTLLLDPSARFGFVREFTVTTMKPEKHYGYAVQWFLMALAWLICAILLYCRPLWRHKKNNGSQLP